MPLSPLFFQLNAVNAANFPLHNLTAVNALIPGKFRPIFRPGYGQAQKLKMILNWQTIHFDLMWYLNFDILEKIDFICALTGQYAQFMVNLEELLIFTTDLENTKTWKLAIFVIEN